ncbi:hypothetical protein SASPL_144441 [Salvia splendens]|uniref:Tyrosinase copper-binding domain-containing protein n=1 Tax=Salvia splendens TaxID=180675 RepID=A0A8X8Z6G6_SALSN|nr:polyphenol oxidase I, chloroplastic-like [Salvia splendens]KAG6393867.1 hypothetical protein SASPL_144441 [Salvia splendens]
MASLQFSFTALSSAPKPRSSRLPGRSHRSQISCSGDGGGGIDRRNMLLGLGGLYGAGSSLGRKAEALPILPPDLSTCDPTGATTTRRVGDKQEVVKLDVNCCPPFTDKQGDYKLPVFTKLRRRQSAHRLSPANLAKYKKAMAKMRELDVTDPDDPRGFTQQANIHCAYCNGPYDQVGHPGVDLQVHNSWTFFPFHRWYLYFYERILGELIGDPTFALPYWNWDNPRGMSMPMAFDDPSSSLYDEDRNQAHRRPAVVDLALNSGITDPVQLISNNLALMYKEMVSDVETAVDFLGTEYRAGDDPHAFALGGTSERGSHTGIHAWVGDPRNDLKEDMGNFYSAGRDPIFYCHHANVDRMWTIWDKIPASYSKKVDDDDFKNSSFMFYDEKKNLVRVKISDCLDHRKLGYEYEYSDTPWINSRPPQRAVPANLKELAKGLPTADKVFPLKLVKTVKFLVPKPAKGKADEALLLENIVTDNSKLIKFDVFINDEDDKPDELDRAEYVGSFTQLPHRVKGKESVNNLRLNLREVYENINIADDDAVVITIVPLISGDAVTIGGIKIIRRRPRK